VRGAEKGLLIQKRLGPGGHILVSRVIDWDPVLDESSESSARVTMTNVRVQCYSGAKANERPFRFELDGRDYMVEEILDQWYGPDDTFFKLRADDNNIYIIRHRPATDIWSLESFRQELPRP
jgi:hypothetical protein